MSEEHEHEHAHEDHSAHYFSVFKLLVIFFIISFVGPFIADWLTEMGVPGKIGFALTMLTAFGVAFLKARLVIVHFMHLPQEKPYVSYILQTCLVLLAIFVAGVMVDVMNHEGENWSNEAAKMAVENGKEAMKALESGH